MIQARQMCWGLVALLVASGCAPLRPKPPPRRLQPPRATLADVTAPRQATDEADRLARTPSGQLRRAWLLLQAGQDRQAVNTTNGLLYDSNRQPPSIQSLAYFVRGQAFLRQGNLERAREDLRKAGSLAIRAELKNRCADDLAALAPPPKPPNRRNTTPPRNRVAKVQISPRHNWKATRPVASRLDQMNGIRRLTIHHSANIARSTSSAAIAATIRSIQQVHVAQNGWGDIAYHFLIDPAGRIWQGRSLNYQGAHAGGANNHHNIGICLLGKFTNGGQRPSSRQIGAMTRLVQWLRIEHRIPVHGVLTHKEIKAETDCPGTRLQAEVNRMRRRYAATSASAKGLVVGGSR